MHTQNKKNLENNVYLFIEKYWQKILKIESP